MDRHISELAAYAASLRFEDLSEEAVHQCKRRFIDTLGCALGAFDAESCRMARAVAGRYRGESSARILGTLEPSSPEHAAFANGVMLRYLDFSDAYYMKSSGHPSDTLAPVLSLGEALHVDGRSAITAAVLGYEVFCNFSDVIEHEQGWDYVFQTVVACAVASGKLLGLSEAQMAQAIALAITPNLALEQTRTGEISMWKNYAAANAARNGIFAAVLAKEGITGPAEAMDGKWGLQSVVGKFEWAPFGGRGGPFRVTQTHMKYYPAVVHSQSGIAAALELHSQVDPAEIESIKVETYWVARRYADRAVPSWRPRTHETAHLSVPFVLAAALLDGTITTETYSDARRADPRLQALLDKMTVIENPDFTKAHPQKWPYRIELILRSGKPVVAHAEYFKGHAKNPMSDAEVEAKYRELMAPVLQESQINQLLSTLWTMERLPDIGDVISLTGITKPGA
jgi:2-methylcitrate dehydratase